MVYTFGSIAFRGAGYSDVMIGFLWAIGVATEIIFFVVAGRRFGGAGAAYVFLMLGGASAILRWIAMSFALPTPLLSSCRRCMRRHSRPRIWARSSRSRDWSAKRAGRRRKAGFPASMRSSMRRRRSLRLSLNAFGPQAYLAMAAIAAAGLALVAIAALDPRRM